MVLEMINSHRNIKAKQRLKSQGVNLCENEINLKRIIH